LAGNTETMQTIFKKCTKCGQIWRTQIDFISDPETDIIGYQANFKDLELGLFLFNHLKCGTTIAFHAGQFAALYNGPIFKERHTQQNGCPEYCLNKNTLNPCVMECECAYIREIIQEIRKKPKQNKYSTRDSDTKLDK